MSEPSVRLVIQWREGEQSSVWQAGYMVAGNFRPFAGGTSEETLQAVIEAERRRTPGLVTEVRR